MDVVLTFLREYNDVYDSYQQINTWNIPFCMKQHGNIYVGHFVHLFSFDQSILFCLEFHLNTGRCGAFSRNSLVSVRALYWITAGRRLTKEKPSYCYFHYQPAAVVMTFRKPWPNVSNIHGFCHDIHTLNIIWKWQGDAKHLAPVITCNQHQRDMP